MSKKRIRLSAGPHQGCALIALPAGVFLGSVTACMAWGMLDQVRRFVVEGDFGISAVLWFVALAVLIGVLLLLAASWTWACLRIARYKIWLKGTVLVERRIVLRRRVDLRTARVELRSTHGNATERRAGIPGQRAGGLPAVSSLSLAATDQRSGKSLDLLIQEGDTTLPASELAALAQAIVGDHDLAQRVGHDQAEAMIVAERLRELVDEDAHQSRVRRAD